MSFFFDEKTATDSLGEISWATGNRTNYLENFRASLNANYATDRSDSQHNAVRKEYSLLVDTLHNKGYTNFDVPIKGLEDLPIGPEDPRAYAKREALQIIEPTDEENIFSFWQRIEELKANNPEIARELLDLGYDSQENFKKTIGIKAKELWEKHHDISSRSTGWGTVGSFVGAFAALGTDPLVLATLPIGFAYRLPGTLLANAWRSAWVEGLIGTAVEIPIQFKVQPYRKEVGLPTEIEIGGVTVPLGVLNVLTVGAGAFTLGGLLQLSIGGTAKGVTQLRKALNSSTDAEIEKISNALKIETPEELSKTKLPDNPFEETASTNIVNNKNHNAAQISALNDTKVKIEEIVAPIKQKSLDDIQGNVVRYKPEEIEFDPTNFQYKTDVDVSGVSKKLASVTEWDEPSAGTIVVYEFTSGKKAVVDGHQRVALAKRLSNQGKKITLLSHTFREVDGILPEEAMIKGLMINLRNNTGTAIDAAKILRSKFGGDWKTFEKSLPARSNLVKNTKGLIALSDDAWGMVVNNKNLENLAARVGLIIEDKSLHANIIKVLKDKTFTSLAELEQTLRLTNTLPKTVTKQKTLFGTDFFAETLLVERSQLLNWAKKNINRKTIAFKTIVENDKTLQKAGNKLNKLNNEEQRILYEEVQDRIEQVATQAGSYLSGQLTKAAKLLQEGKREAAEKLFLQATDDAAAKGDFRRSDVSGSFGADKTEIETQTLPPKFEEDLTTNKLFSEPAKGAADQVDALSDSVLGVGISKAIKEEVGNGAIVSTSPAVKSLSIDQPLVKGSQRTKATPPSTVFAEATASPPSFLGNDKISVGTKSSITNEIIYHNIDDLTELKLRAEKNFDGYKAGLEQFKEKHPTADIVVSLKHKEKDGARSIANKLARKKSATHFSDLLRARIDVDTIDAARAIAQDIKNKYGILGPIDDFLKSEARADGYRGIHIQVMMKDGMSAELQVRLKSMSSILTRSHKLRKMKAEDFKTAKGRVLFNAAKQSIKAELDDAWFRAIGKQGLASEELVDGNIVIGKRIEPDGTEVDIIKPIREFVEEDAKELAAIERLKDCV